MVLKSEKTLSNEEGSSPQVEPSFRTSWLGFCNRFMAPVNGASLAVFRIVFGLIMFFEAYSLLRPSESSSGKVILDVYYTGANIVMHFPYPGFAWLPWFSVSGMHLLVWVLGIGSLLVATGCFYRISSMTVFLCWGYLYAVESTRTYWMSYYYLELCVCFLMLWLPAASIWSIDAWRARIPQRTRSVPFWSIIVLRGQLVIMYFFAGLAKINEDWLLDAQPLRYFLSHPHVSDSFSTIVSQEYLIWINKILHSDFLAYFIANAGAVFDLSVGGLMLFRRTRLFGFVLMLVFHGVNHTILFDDILWFPFLGIASALIFFEPDWPVQLKRWLSSPNFVKPDFKWACLGAISIPFLGAALGWKGTFAKPLPFKQVKTAMGFKALILVALWLVGQGLFPLRHYLIAGDARITFEGLSWSWRLKAEVYRSKPCEISIHDEKILHQDKDGKTVLNRDHWNGDPVVYRTLDIEQIDWNKLPEILIIKEPILGERILFNTFASPVPYSNLQEMSQRVLQLWENMYHRQPDSVQPLVALDYILDNYLQALNSKGYQVKSRSETLDILLKQNGPNGDGKMIPFLRRMQPFGLYNVSPVKNGIFLIEDAKLMSTLKSKIPQLNRSAWMESSSTSLPEGSNTVNEGQGSFLVLHIPKPTMQTRSFMPRACLMEDFSDGIVKQPYINWDYLQDISMSKGMHISTSPFHLQRYALRVVDLWEKENGRRPRITATTHVSLNFRPHQQMVDSKVDLSSVQVSRWTHNEWIKDLELKRIPENFAETRWGE